MRYQFYNFPIKLTLEDYASVKEVFLSEAASRTDILSVYSFGGTLSGICPGMSDIDLLLVIKDRKRKMPEPAGQSALAKYILDLRPIDQACFEDIQKIFYYVGMEFRHEAGLKIDIKPLSEDEKKLALITNLVAVTLQGLSCISEYRAMGNIDVRGALKLLHGIRHDIDKLKFFGCASCAWDGFISDEELLRQQWFVLPRGFAVNKLLLLLEKARTVLAEALGLLAGIMGREGFAMPAAAGNEQVVFSVNRNTVLVFSDDLWTGHSRDPHIKVRNVDFPGSFPPSIRKAFDLAKWKVIVAPRVIAVYFLIHARQGSSFSLAISSRLLGKAVEGQMPAKASLEKELQAQKMLYEDYWELLMAQGVKSGAGRFFSFFVPESMFFYSPVAFLRWISRAISPYNRRRALDEVARLGKRH